MGTVGREGKRVGAIRLFEYLKTCQLAMLEMVRPPVRAIEIHDAIADQDRLCLALSRAQAVKVGCMYCQVAAGCFTVEHGGLDRQCRDGIADAREGVRI